MLVFRTFGLECHLCFQPTAWYIGGISFPCQCGTENAGHLADAIKAGRDYKPPLPEPLPAPRKTTPVSHRPLPRRPEPVDLDPWSEIADVLVALNGELLRRRDPFGLAG